MGAAVLAGRAVVSLQRPPANMALKNGDTAARTHWCAGKSVPSPRASVQSQRADDERRAARPRRTAADGAPGAAIATAPRPPQP